MKSLTTWRIVVASAILLIFLSFGIFFTPGESTPFLFSLPYVLWSSILITALLVVLTFIGTRVFPFKED
jgi:hypothetical protein